MAAEAVCECVTVHTNEDVHLYSAYIHTTKLRLHTFEKNAHLERNEMMNGLMIMMVV